MFGKIRLGVKVPKLCQIFRKFGLRVKVPKLWQIFGKIGLGVKVPKLWQIFGKLASGNVRGRAPNSENTCTNSTERRTERQWTRGESNPRPTLTDRPAFA